MRPKVGLGRRLEPRCAAGRNWIIDIISLRGITYHFLSCLCALELYGDGKAGIKENLANVSMCHHHHYLPTTTTQLPIPRSSPQLLTSNSICVFDSWTGHSFLCNCVVKNKWGPDILSALVTWLHPRIPIQFLMLISLERFMCIIVPCTIDLVFYFLFLLHFCKWMGIELSVLCSLSVYAVLNDSQGLSCLVQTF